MKQVILALAASLLMQPALAQNTLTPSTSGTVMVAPAVKQESASRKKLGKSYHYFVYYPVMVVAFVAGGIPVLVHHANMRMDEAVQEWAGNKPGKETGD